MSFGGAYRGRRVLVTGHTGFKGSWLCRWLLEEGATVAGYALAPATNPALFDLLGLEKKVKHTQADVRDHDSVSRAVREFSPEAVFHLAAQPLVRRSYAEPKETWDVNIGGTVNVLEAVRACPGTRACVVVTSDKCYENREQQAAYRESDAMGGHDPYSASKGACELLVASWRRSFFFDPSRCNLATARAGNVIGGGDWSADRLVTDFIAAIAAGKPLVLRNPSATRPWQHVLEPLSGYLHLGAKLLGNDGKRFAAGWNFGPGPEAEITVGDLAQRLVSEWGSGEVRVEGAGQPHEAGRLALDCTQAREQLGWRGIWPISETIRRTVTWYREHHRGSDISALTRQQLMDYCGDANRAGLS